MSGGAKLEGHCMRKGFKNIYTSGLPTCLLQGYQRYAWGTHDGAHPLASFFATPGILTIISPS